MRIQLDKYVYKDMVSTEKHWLVKWFNDNEVPSKPFQVSLSWCTNPSDSDRYYMIYENGTREISSQLWRYYRFDSEQEAIEYVRDYIEKRKNYHQSIIEKSRCAINNIEKFESEIFATENQFFNENKSNKNKSNKKKCGLVKPYKRVKTNYMETLLMKYGRNK